MQHTVRPKPAPFHRAYSRWAGAETPLGPLAGRHRRRMRGWSPPSERLACPCARGSTSPGVHASRASEVESGENASCILPRCGRGPRIMIPSLDAAGVGTPSWGRAIRMMMGSSRYSCAVGSGRGGSNVLFDAGSIRGRTGERPSPGSSRRSRANRTGVVMRVATAARLRPATRARAWFRGVSPGERSSVPATGRSAGRVAWRRSRLGAKRRP